MQRIYGFVQEEDGVVSRLLTEISAYFEYLARQHGDYVAFHNVKIPMEGYMSQLAPYNINRNPYCLYVKSKPEVWNTCIARQGKVVNCCASGPFLWDLLCGDGRIRVSGSERRWCDAVLSQCQRLLHGRANVNAEDAAFRQKI